MKSEHTMAVVAAAFWILAGPAWPQPTTPQTWRLSRTEPAPGTVNIYSTLTAQPDAYLEWMTQPGPWPDPSFTCVAKHDLTLKVAWRLAQLPPSVRSLQDLMDRGHQVTLHTDPYGPYLVSDTRFSDVGIAKVGRFYEFAATFEGSSAAAMIEELTGERIVELSLVDAEGDSVTRTMDFRASHRTILAVLLDCGY